jgi:alpha-beta hydrolase superfamily lysophospholipase
MKLFFVIILVGLVERTNAQKIFDYEQKIELSGDYKRKEINFTSIEDDVKLSGTLIYPTKEFNKVVIIVPGSGKDTRHCHFDIAKEFLINQIAVYRFDERGIGKSEGRYKRNHETASSLEKDVIAAFKQLKNEEILSNKKIGILGHSLGGIASIGAFGKGCNFDFLIQMATPVENNGAFLKYQVLTNTGGYYTVKGKTSNEVLHFIDTIRKTVQQNEDYKTSKKKIKPIIKQLNFRKGRHIVNPVIIDLMKQNHEETYKTSAVPILFIIGSQDKIVSSKDEIQTLRRLNNSNITISLIDKADHYLNDKIGAQKLIKSPYQMTDEALKGIINWTLDK